MFRCLLIAASLVVSTAAFADHSPQNQNDAVVSRQKVNNKLARLDKMLAEAMSKARNPHRSQELQDIRAELEELREYVQRQPDAVTQPNPGPGRWMPPPPPVAQVQQLSQLLYAIQREGFSDGKLRVLQTAASSHYFVVAQVKQLLNAFPFSSDKLNAAAVLKPRILDNENNYQLYDAFPMSSDKAKLSEVLARR